METAILSYLKHQIEIKVPNPAEDNQILVSIHREAGTYDPEEYNAYLTEYQFSASSDDPNNWVKEGIDSAIAVLSNRGVNFHETVIAYEPSKTVISAEELDDIPF